MVFVAKLWHRLLKANVRFLPVCEAIEALPSRLPKSRWWEIPIEVENSIFARKKRIDDVEVAAIRYLGNTRIGEGIALRWRTRDGHDAKCDLEHGRTAYVRFLRQNIGDHRVVLLSDAVHREQIDKWVFRPSGFYRFEERQHSGGELDDLRWSIRLWTAEDEWESPKFYHIGRTALDGGGERIEIQMIERLHARSVHTFG